MKTLIILGPPGAGKTTLAGDTFRAGTLPGTTAYVFNDEGTADTVDAGILAGLTDFRALTSGCFGCRDSQQFLELIEELEASQAYDWLIIEPLGFIAGHELPELLAGHGHQPQVFSLLDALHLEQNDALGIVPSQLQAATLGIGITKAAGTEPDEALFAYVQEHAPGRPVFLVPPNGGLPPEALARHRLPVLTQAHHHHGCGCGRHHHDEHHGCGHNHDHGHEHDHGYVTYSFPLRPETSLEKVKAAFAVAPSGVIRAKGAIGGHQFHLVHGTWEATIPDERAFVTFYALEPVEADWLDGLTREKPTERHSTKDLLRSVGNADTETSVALLRQWIDRCPTAVSYAEDGPVIYTEASELVNELRKRPDVQKAAPELVAEAIRSRVDHAVRVIRENPPGSYQWSRPGSAQWKRNAAAAATWFALHTPDALGEERLAAIRDLPIAALIGEGLAGLERHHSDPETAEVFLGEALDAVDYADPHRTDPAIVEALRHCRELAERSPAHAHLAPRWH